MKKFLLLLFLTGGMRVFAQPKKTDTAYVLVSNLRVKFEPLSFPSHLDDVYEIKPNSTKMLDCNVLKVFCHSSTIYDESQIILVDSSRFFCYFIGCIDRFYSAGYYKKDGAILKLQTDNQVAHKFAKLMSKNIKGYVKYNNLSDTTFIIADNRLSQVSK